MNRSVRDAAWSRGGPGRRDFLRMASAGAIALGAAPLLSACGSADTGPKPVLDGPPRRGGRLRIGVAGGSAKDTLDAHVPVSQADIARVLQLHDTLASYDPDYKTELALAEEITPSADARTWTIRLRQGVEFHHGKSADADDLIYTLQRIIDPKAPKSGAQGLSALDPQGITKLDSRTVRLQLRTPDAALLDALAQYSIGLVPQDYDPKKPVGTGPFAFDSFSPGEQSIFVKNRSYWREDGGPYVDDVTIIGFPDDTARVNALFGRQVDAISQVPLGLLRVLDADPNLRLLESKTGSWLPFTMRVDRPPFDDVRVRQAMRLVVDREQMVEQVLSGRGTIGNDLYAPFDQDFNSALPQRKRDVAEAKRLLAAAGQQDLEVELVTSPIAAGVVEAAQAFAQQAKDAGVTVNIRRVNDGEFFGDNYLKWDFAQDFWFTRNFLPQASAGSLPKSPYNETHFADEDFAALVSKARATIDPAERKDLIARAQKVEYDRGGYIVWGFPNQLDAYGGDVGGFAEDASGIPLSSYRLRNVWLEQ